MSLEAGVRYYPLSHQRLPPPRSDLPFPTRRRSDPSPPPSLSQEKEVVEYLDHDLGCHMPGRVVVREGSDYLVKPLIDNNTNYQERAVSAAEIRPLPNKEVGPGASADELKVGMKLESWFPEDGRWVVVVLVLHVHPACVTNRTRILAC